jgi:hypothetical protein
VSKILNFLFSHYVGMFLAGAVLTPTSVQAYPSGSVVASVESPKSQPAQAGKVSAIRVPRSLSAILGKNAAPRNRPEITISKATIWLSAGEIAHINKS